MSIAFDWFDRISVVKFVATGVCNHKVHTYNINVIGSTTVWETELLFRVTAAMCQNVGPGRDETTNTGSN